MIDSIELLGLVPTAGVEPFPIGTRVTMTLRPGGLDTT